MKKVILVLAILVLVFGCSKEDLYDYQEDITSQTLEDNNSMFARTFGLGSSVVTGYNMRWRNTPSITKTNVASLMDSLKTGVFRYPGGTVTHKWNWKNGYITGGAAATDFVHKIEDVKRVVDTTKAKVSFVLDVVNSSLKDQIEMIKAAKVPVSYIELGNELYAPDYTTEFPTGKAYADTINSWVPELRKEFSGVKIGAVLIARTTNKDRSKTWNNDVTKNITKPVDAHIYHVYIAKDESVADRITRLASKFVSDSSVETWITEYGDKGQTVSKTFDLAKKLTASPYNAKLMLNHCIIAVSGNFTKIKKTTSNANKYTFTDEGIAFLNKFNPYVSALPYQETFEDYSGTYNLKNTGIRTFKHSNQTLPANKLIAFEENAGKYTSVSDVTATSNKGITISHDLGSSTTETKVLDNILVSPLIVAKDKTSLTLQVDAAYNYEDENNAKVTYYWSTTYKGESTFDSSKWTELGDNTVSGMGDDYAEEVFKRNSFNINNSGNNNIYIAIRVNQTLNSTNYRTQWRFDNIKVSSN